MALTEEDVLQILKLIESSNFDFLQLEMGDLKLTVSKHGGVASVASAQPAPAPAATPAPPPQPAAQPAPAKPAPTRVVAREGTVPIKAPMVGTFYTTPSPGAPPFVKAGDRVEKESTVGLIEVMKVFNAVTAGVAGTIVEICVENGQFVEYGQTLFLVSPEGSR
jgi:acetyl-CoA carboxylase biotin carboxyl carrier protein